MTTVPDLSPAELAAQLGRPDGDVGLAIAAWMNDFNWPVYRACHEALMVQQGDQILEIGFGNGHHVPDLLARAENLQYEGFDLAPSMVAEAKRFCAGRFADGTVNFRLGETSTMPLAPGQFDRAIAVNVVYFWHDPVGPLAAMRRVLRSGGVCVIGAVDPASQTGPYASSAYGYYQRDLGTLVAAHHEAGFRKVGVRHLDYVVTRPHGQQVNRRYNIVVSQS